MMTSLSSRNRPLLMSAVTLATTSGTRQRNTSTPPSLDDVKSRPLRYRGRADGPFEDLAQVFVLGEQPLHDQVDGALELAEPDLDRQLCHGATTMRPACLPRSARWPSRSRCGTRPSRRSWADAPKSVSGSRIPAAVSVIAAVLGFADRLRQMLGAAAGERQLLGR